MSQQARAALMALHCSLAAMLFLYALMMDERPKNDSAGIAVFGLLLTLNFGAVIWRAFYWLYSCKEKP